MYKKQISDKIAQQQLLSVSDVAFNAEKKISNQEFKGNQTGIVITNLVKTKLYVIITLRHINRGER